jgi:hypothetical protein
MNITFARLLLHLAFIYVIIFFKCRTRHTINCLKKNIDEPKKQNGKSIFFDEYAKLSHRLTYILL